MKITQMWRDSLWQMLSRRTLLIMRYSVILLFGILLQVSATGLAQRVVIEKSQMTYKELFKEIEKQTGLITIYNNQQVDKRELVNIADAEQDISELYQALLEEKGLTFEVIDDYIVIKKAAPKPRIAENMAQQEDKKITITGVISDSKGEPLPFAAIRIKGTTIGTVSDANGTYTLLFEKQEGVVFEVSSLGFETLEVRYTGQANINVTLEESISGLDEVVVVGYGSTHKKDLTGTVGSVKAEALTKIKTQSVEGALSGQLAGVFVAPSSGEPGAASTVHIRGLSQINGNNQPLYVIDGVPIIINPEVNDAGQSYFGLSQSGTRVNPLLTIDPDNVERIDVLKDASAAAIYGSRAANGVILITTKKGKKGEKTSLNFSVNTSIQNPTNSREYASAPEWKQLMTTLAQYDLDNTTYPEFLIPILLKKQYDIVNKPEEYFGTENTNWEDLMLNKNAVWNKYSLRITGGNENVSYSLAGSIDKQEGVVIDNELGRYNVNAHVDAQINKLIRTGGTLNYSYTKSASTGITGLNYANYRPDMGVYNEDGSFTSTSGYFGETYNPLGNYGRNKNETTGQSMYGSFYGELHLLDALKFKSQINVGLNTNETERFVPSFNNGFYAVLYNRPGATMQVQNNLSWTTSFVNTVNYNRTINYHRIDAVAGISWDQSQTEYKGVTYRGFPDDTKMINVGSASFAESPLSAHGQNGLNSIFGRFNYGYRDKYLATFTARRDASTKFGPGKRVGFFPSGALAWNMHNEDFLGEVAIIDQLKLRASMGITGSDNLKSFSYLPYYNNGFFYDNDNGMLINNLPNNNIKWEETSQLDIGVEFALFKNRLMGEVVYFEKNTSDIILNVPVTAETGSSYWNNNVADVSNKGWEFMLGADIIRSDNFAWNSSFNISFIKNNVDKLHGGSTHEGYNTGIVEGYAMGVVQGRVVEKIAQTQDEIDALNAKAPGGVYDADLKLPGDYIFKDLDGDKRITSIGDTKVIGDITPDYFGGWNNNFRIKNWDLGMNWAYAKGIDKEYSVLSIDWYYNSYESNVDKLVISESWTPENTDAKYARFGSRSSYNSNSNSIQDASYIKLRSASIAYNIPKSLLDKVGVAQARLTLSGNNLLTFTKYEGLDPESGSNMAFSTISQTSDRGSAYPNTTTYTIGLNVTF